MPVSDRALFDHITEEVAATCAARGWRPQIRRKWSVRERPVWESGVDDHEWKLVVDSWGVEGSAGPSEFDEGLYYVLSFDTAAREFTLQHDTLHAGALGRHWSQVTSTRFRARLPGGEPGLRDELRDHLLDLTRRFGPNRFSIT